jgi:hypothetical protein
MRSFIIIIIIIIIIISSLQQKFYDDQIMKEDMCGECSTLGENDKCIRHFGEGDLTTRKTWDGWMDLKETGCERVGWVHLARDRVQWRAIVNTVMNLRVP